MILTNNQSKQFLYRDSSSRKFRDLKILSEFFFFLSNIVKTSYYPILRVLYRIKLWSNTFEVSEMDKEFSAERIPVFNVTWKKLVSIKILTKGKFLCCQMQYLRFLFS